MLGVGHSSSSSSPDGGSSVHGQPSISGSISISSMVSNLLLISSSISSRAHGHAQRNAGGVGASTSGGLVCRASERERIHERTVAWGSTPPILRSSPPSVEGQELLHLVGGVRGVGVRSKYWFRSGGIQREYAEGGGEPKHAKSRSVQVGEKGEGEVGVATCVRALRKVFSLPLSCMPCWMPCLKGCTSGGPIQAISRVPKNMTGTSPFLWPTLPSFF